MKLSSRMRVVVAILILCVKMASHQEVSAQLPAITFELITSKDGLPSNTVFSATRDSAGFMWFGTRHSPVRYDGLNFKIFDAYTTNFITGIKADKNNSIWLSSDRSGVSKIDRTTLEMTQVSKKVNNRTASTGDFFIDSRGDGWFSDHYGVNRINLLTHEIKHYPFRQTNFVWLKAAFAEDNDNNLWVIGRDNGLFRLDLEKDSLICVLGADSPGEGVMRHLIMATAIVDKEGTLWIGTYNEGLLKFNPKTYAVQKFRTGRPDNKIISLEEGVDENNKRILWVGDDHGLGIFRPEQQQFYFFSDLMSKTYQVHAIYRDPDGIVWACTSDGILRYHPQRNVIQVISIPREVLREAVAINTILQDRRPGQSHIFYLGLANSTIVRWDRHKNLFTTISLPARSADVRWIAQDDQGMLWIGTNRWDYERPGIFVYDVDARRFAKTPLSLQANQFFSVPFFMYGILKDKTIWVGNSDEGIHLVDEHKETTPWPTTAMKNLVKNNNLINDMMIDRSDTLWIGCYKGVFYFDKGKKEFVAADPDVLPYDADDRTVNTLLEDRHGNVWAARWGSLSMMTKLGEIKKVLSINNGFKDREIKGLVEDVAGNIWIGNHEGLYCYKVQDDRLMRFTMNDGLISNNTAGRIFTTRDQQELFVMGVGGFNVVKVSQIHRQRRVTPLIVNSFKIHQTEFPVDVSKPIRLSPSQNVFSVDFVALNYRKHDDNQYAYYLEGFENDWNYIGSNHTAYYTNLNPGEYILHMKSGDSFGNWSNEVSTMRIEVLPAFYQTMWFKILVSLVVAGAIYAFFQYRINQLLQLQRVRNRISADLHDELGSTLSGISIMGSLVKKELPQQHSTEALVDRIMEDVRQISSSLDDIVWNISPKNDTLSSLIARMTRYASELFEAKQIAFAVDIPQQSDDTRLSMEQRRNIYLIFKESVNNLVKYSKCTHAFVGIKMDKKHVFLTVTDNGVGFDVNKSTDRNGIRNLKARAQSLRGVIEIHSTQGTGTSIVLRFPI